MEVRSARFLRARYDDLAKMAYPVSCRSSIVDMFYSGFLRWNLLNLRQNTLTPMTS